VHKVKTSLSISFAVKYNITTGSAKRPGSNYASIKYDTRPTSDCGAVLTVDFSGLEGIRNPKTIPTGHATDRQ